MNAPNVAPLVDGWRFTWTQWQIHVDVARFRESSRGTDVHAEMTFWRDGKNPKILTQGQISLTSLQVRERTAAQLKKLAEFPDWITIMETVCIQGLQCYRKGPLDESLEPTDQDQTAWFVLNPLLYHRNQTVIYGPGEAGKSLFGLYCAMLCASGASETGLVCAPDGHEVLYLDWEMTAYEQRARIRQLRAGHPALLKIPHYHRLVRPLAEHAQELRSEIADKHITIVVIDSLALAAGGELEKTESATRFESALNALNVSSLVLAHVAKNPEQKTIFGSVFFHNLARSVWEICAGESDTTKRFALYHRKNNLGKRFPPMGFELSMTDRAAHLAIFDPAEDPELSQAMPVPQRIKLLMADGKERSVGMIAPEVQKPENYVKKVMNQYKGRYWTALTQGGKGRGDETLWVRLA